MWLRNMTFDVVFMSQWEHEIIFDVMNEPPLLSKTLSYHLLLRHYGWLLIIQGYCSVINEYLIVTFAVAPAGCKQYDIFMLGLYIKQ